MTAVEVHQCTARELQDVERHLLQHRGYLLLVNKRSQYLDRVGRDTAKRGTNNRIEILVICTSEHSGVLVLLGLDTLLEHLTQSQLTGRSRMADWVDNVEIEIQGSV